MIFKVSRNVGGHTTIIVYRVYTARPIARNSRGWYIAWAYFSPLRFLLAFGIMGYKLFEEIFEDRIHIQCVYVCMRELLNTHTVHVCLYIPKRIFKRRVGWLFQNIPQAIWYCRFPCDCRPPSSRIFLIHTCICVLKWVTLSAKLNLTFRSFNTTPFFFSILYIAYPFENYCNYAKLNF